MGRRGQVIFWRIASSVEKQCYHIHAFNFCFPLLLQDIAQWIGNDNGRMTIRINNN